MLTNAILVRRPADLPADLRIVRTELIAMEYAGTPTGRVVTDGWQLVVFGDPKQITDAHRAALKAAGWVRFHGRNAGTFRKKITVRFES
jgi:hypothetical protein